MFEFLYITNDPERARFVRGEGVDFIFVDMEYLGKDSRQPGNTVKNRHTIQDVEAICSAGIDTNLLVRINPYGVHSEAEIESAIRAGATHIMLPFITDLHSVSCAREIIGSRAYFVPLIETVFSLRHLDDIIEWCRPEFVYFGLNDLHLELRLSFMFEVLANGLLDFPALICKKKNVRFGFGGATKLNSGVLNSTLIFNEHKRLGSSFVILSRDFQKNVADVEFGDELLNIRQHMDSYFDDGKLMQSSFDLKLEVKRLVNGALG